METYWKALLTSQQVVNTSQLVFFEALSFNEIWW